ncbi:MAG: prepilin-type N-terminal cleavage/methylation domain-containing protein [Deltaproteobacteria bacterium]|nr:MAG: prepilin-type N-terminal cleavage/methylation domain-containing protein [Deltaproteobacteria bacterium]
MWRHRSEAMRRPPRALRRREGFTLLEVMIALLILGTGLAVLIENNAASLKIHAITRRMTVVTQLARMKMAEIEIDDELDEGFESGDFGPDFPGYRWEYDAAEETLSFTIYPGLPPVEIEGIRVKLRVYWREGETEQVEELEGFFTKPGTQVPAQSTLRVR